MTIMTMIRDRHITTWLLLLLLMMTGVQGAWAAQTTIYERGEGTSTAWSASDISGGTAWTANTAGTTFVVQGSPAVLYMSGGNASYEYQKALNINPNARLTITGTWNTGSSLGRDAAYNYLRFGNVELRVYGQGEKGSIVINGEETILTTDKGDVRGDQDWRFNITITQATGAVSYTITPPSGAKNGTGNAGVLDFSAIKMGYLKTGSLTDTHQTLKAISISEETYTYTVNATGSLTQKIASGSDGGPGASLTIPYHRYILSGSTLHKADKQGSDPHYGKTFTLSSDNQAETITYASDATNVAVFKEAEDFLTPVTNNNYVYIRCSGTGGGYASTAQTVATLPSGAYTITAASYGRPTDFVFSSGGEDKWTHSASAWGESTSGNVQLAEGDLQVRGGSNAYPLDYVYVTRVFAYDLTSTTYNIGTLSYTTTNPTLTNTSGATVTYSSSNTVIAEVNSSTGVLTFHHNGTVYITAKATISGTEYWTYYRLDITGETSATETWTPATPTTTETYTLSGTGYIDQTAEGTLVTMSYGSATETQTVTDGKAHCIDAYGYYHVFLNASGVPTMGTYYTFVPKQNGTLTINAMVSEDNGKRNGLRLVDGDGNILERITSIGTSYQDYAFNTLLIKDKIYYVFAETGAMETKLDDDAYSTLWLNSFTFRQMEGTTISLIDQSLLFTPNDNANFHRLDRTIPGFDITFGGGDGAKYQGAGTFIFRNNVPGTEDYNGSITITPRLKSGNVTITSVTLNFGAETKGTPSVYINGTDKGVVTANSTQTYSGLSGNTLTVKLKGYDEDTSKDVNNNYINKNKVSFLLNSLTILYSLTNGATLDNDRDQVELKFAKDYIYGYEGETPDCDIYFNTPTAFYGDVNFTYSNDTFGNGCTNAVTKYKEGEKVHLNDGNTTDPYKVRIGKGVSTLTASFAGTDYFAPASATTRLYSRDYEESPAKVLASGKSYIWPAGNGMTFEITTQEAGTITLNGGENITMTAGEAHTYTVESADNKVVVTNTGASDITITKVKVYRKSATLDFSYVGAVGAGSDVLFTSWNYTPNTFTISSETETGIADKYDKTTGTYTYAITQPVSGVSIDHETGALTVGAEADNGLLQVTLTVNPKEAYKELYAPLTKTITLKVVDGMWDFRTYSRAEHYTMYNSTGWSGQEGGWYAGRDIAEFADILRKDNTPLPRALSLQTMGKHRLLHKDPCNLHLQGKGTGVIESPNGGGQVRIPTKAGMLVEVNCFSEDILSEMEIEGVTDLEGNNVTYFYVNNNDTESQYFLAKSDGYIVVRNPSFNLDLHIRYIKVSADMAFKYGNETYIDASVGTWSNPVMNQGTTTITYERTDGGTGIYTVDSGTGVVTIGSGQYGKFTVTATGSGTGVLAGKSGSYIAYSIGVTRNSTSSSVAISGTPAEFTLKDLFDIAVGGTDLTESDLKDKIVFNVITPSPTVTLDRDRGILTVEGVQEVKLTATLGAITIPFTCEVTGGTLTGGLNPVIANDATSYTITIEGESGHKFNLKAMYEGIMGDIKDSKTSLVFKNVDNPESPVELSVDATEVSCSNLCIEGFSTIKKGGVIPIYAGYTHSTTSYPIEGTLTVAYTKHTWNFTSNLIPKLAKWQTNSEAGSYTTKTNTWGTGATIDQPTDEGTKDDHYHWKFRRKIPGKTDGAIVYYYNHSVEGQNALVIPETEGLHVFSSPSNQQMGVEMMQDGGVATVPYDCRNLMLLRGGKVTIPKLEKGQWVEVRWTRHKEEMGERILMTNLSDVAGTEITSTYKIGNCFYNLPWSTSTYMFQATEDGDVTFEVADNIYVSIQEIILHEPGWKYKSSMSGTLKGYDDTASYTDEVKNAWTGVTAPDVKWVYLWNDDAASHTITLLPREYQNAPNAPQTWKFEIDEMLTREGAKMTTTSTDNRDATITYNGGWGKVKVTMTCYSQNMKYVANQKTWTLTFGQAPKQTYPYTWDFTKFFSSTLGSTTNDITWAAVSYDSGSTNPLRVAIYNNHSSADYAQYPNTYNTDDYQSYYVEGGQLVSYGLRGTNNGVLRETEGLGFKLDADAKHQPDQNMLLLNMTNSVAAAQQATNGQTWKTITGGGHQTESHLTIATGGKVIVPKPNDANFSAYYIYIKSSNEPSYNTSVKKMVSGTAADATQLHDDNYDVPIDKGVYKYQFSANADAEFTFTSSAGATDAKLENRNYTDIYAIAVTKDFKTLKKLSGTGWATESRDYAVDYTLDSLLTNRPLQAFSVIARSSNPIYSENKAKTTVRLQDRNYVVPARQGLVLKQVTDCPEDVDTYKVPLFVPAVTTATDPEYVFANNLMRPNLTGEAPGTTNDPQTFTSETENINGVDYTRFILSEWYMTWKKEESTVSTTKFIEGNVPGFYRLHIYKEGDKIGNDELTAEQAANRNKLGANKAYLILLTDKINDPIWPTTTSHARSSYFIGIEGVSDMEEITEVKEVPADNAIYTLSGQRVADGDMLSPGIYIRNGKKYLVK